MVSEDWFQESSGAGVIDLLPFNTLHILAMVDVVAVPVATGLMWWPSSCVLEDLISLASTLCFFSSVVFSSL